MAEAATQRAYQSNQTYTFLARGKEISLRRSSVTAERLGRHFNFPTDSVYIKEEFGNRVEFPNENSKFNFVGFEDGTSFEVFGDGSRLFMAARSSLPIPNLGSSATAVASTVARRPWASTSNSGENRKAKATVRVVLAKLNSSGKPVADAINPRQTFVPIFEESQANVSYVTTFVKTEMKEDKLILMGSNGFQFLEGAGTRGIAFWKMGSRKVFAVGKKSKSPRTSTRVHNESSADSDDSSVFEPSTKRQRSHDGKMAIMNDKLDDVVSAMGQIKSEISTVLALSAKSKIPLSLRNSVQEHFKCKICLEAPMTPPITASKCCGAIIGCEECVQQWYGAGVDVFEKQCPNCRAEKAFGNTFRMVGLDEFLKQLGDIVKGEEI